MEQNFIANLYEIEQYDDTISLYFDVFVGDRNSVSNSIKEKKYESGFLNFIISNAHFSDYFKKNSSKANSLLNYWFELKGNQEFKKTSEDNSVSAIFYSFVEVENQQPLTYFFTKQNITKFNLRKEEDKEFLNFITQQLDISALYDKNKTAQALEELNSKVKGIKEIPEVNVVNFNVGQGNATGVFDKEFNPIFYYDLGGGAYWNKKTYKKTKTFPVNNNPIIILSHWDFDHYESIKRNPNHYKDCKIIAPLQYPTTPSIRKFIDLISAHLYLVDNRDLGKNKTYSFLKLFKCTGKSRNDSGLAIILNLQKDNNISEILLPGDSHYFYIKQRKIVDAICVSHHGGKLYNKRGFPIPNERVNGYAVYSYGTNNNYNHPRIETVEVHINKGWGIDRFNKKYSLSTTNFNVIYSTDENIAIRFNNSVINYLGKYNAFHGLEYNRDIRIAEILSLSPND